MHLSSGMTKTSAARNRPIVYDEEFGGTSFVAFYPEQIKSADPVTYDDDGNVIPLSKRFNTEERDIRYSMGDEENTELELPDERFDPAALAERKDLREQVGKALTQLPPEAREILLLRELGGRRYDEIAEALELDIGTVKSRIFRARKKLCALLEGNFSEDLASKETEGGVQA